MEVGRVFTWQEIKSGKIPDKEGFKKARSFIEDGIDDNRRIIGALLCGSTLRSSVLGHLDRRDDFNFQRSDIDCLVLYQSEHRAEAIDFLEYLVKTVKKKYFVPVEFIPVNYNLAQIGMHTIGPGFLEHLEWAAENGGIIKENPLPLMSFEWNSLARDIEQFIDHKLRELDKRSTELSIMSQEELVGFLQKVLETPINLARKMNQWKSFRASDDSKETTTALYSVIADTKKSELLKSIHRKDRRYSALVKKQSDERYRNESLYKKALEELKSLTGQTYKFVEANALWLKRGL